MYQKIMAGYFGFKVKDEETGRMLSEYARHEFRMLSSCHFFPEPRKYVENLERVRKIFALMTEANP